MAGNTKVLVIGATGYIGQHIAKAAASEPGVTAFALVSKATEERATAERAAAVEKLRSTPDLNVLEVDYTDHAALVDIFKQVTVVISTVGFPLILDQIKFLEAAKEAGTITRFLPSEFGLEPSEKTEHALGQHPLLANKKKVSEAARKLGIPYTLVYANSFAGYFAGNLGQLSPLENDEVNLFGTGDVKAIIVDEADIGRYTVKAALDPRTANKIVRLEPPRNVLTQNELVALAEKVWGKTIKKKHVSAEALVEAYKNGEGYAKTLSYLRYAVWVAGDQTQPKQANHLSSADLYPDVAYKPIEAILKQ